MENLAPNATTTTTTNNVDISDDAWRATFIEYYKTNAPTKIAMVNDKMMVSTVFIIYELVRV